MPTSHPDCSPSNPEDPPPDADPLRVPRALANEGDLVGLVQWIAEHPPTANDLRACNELLVRGIAVASQQSPRRFAEVLHRSSLAFLTFVRMRLQLIVAHRLGAIGENASSQALPDDLQPVMGEIERTMRLEQDLAQTWATTNRRWQLARHRRRRDFEEREVRNVQASNESYEQLVRDGVLPKINTCQEHAEARR